MIQLRDDELVYQCRLRRKLLLQRVDLGLLRVNLTKQMPLLTKLENLLFLVLQRCRAYGA